MKDFNNVKVGDRLKTVRAMGTNKRKGSILTVTQNYGSYVYARDPKFGNGKDNAIYPQDAELYASTKKDLEQEIKDKKKEQENIKKEIKAIEAKIAYLDENGLEEFDDDVFRVHQTLKLVKDGSKGELEQAQLIAELIKGR
jgi:hypothetical protein